MTPLPHISNFSEAIAADPTPWHRASPADWDAIAADFAQVEGPDPIAERLADNLTPIFAAWVKRVNREIGAIARDRLLTDAQKFATLSQRMAALLKELDPVPMADAIAPALFAAQLAGEWDAEQSLEES